MFWVIAILVVFLLVKIFKDNKKVHKNSEDESLQILKNRFARGDITEEEYSSKKSILNAYADHIRTASRLTSGHSAEVDSYTLPIYIRTI